jgi:hypothetical protein
VTGNEVDNHGDDAKGDDNENDSDDKATMTATATATATVRWAAARRDMMTMVMTMATGETIMTRQRRW